MDHKRASTVLLATISLLWLTAALAQGPTEAAEEEGETVTVEETVPALFAVGLSGGFPSYQTAALGVSMQSSFVGLQAKGSWTAAGPFIGLQLRGYPPVPIPLPLYVGVGLGVYGPNVSYHAALGTHVPLGRELRLDLEGGVASVPLLDRRSLAPHLAVGVSYAVPLELEPAGEGSSGPRIGLTIAERSQQRDAAPSCLESVAPVESQLRGVVDRLVDDWIRSARATYGSVYRNLSYSYNISSRSVSGNEATVKVRYRGSVTEIASGKRHSASGTATAEFRWTGCGWAGGVTSY